MEGQPGKDNVCNKATYIDGTRGATLGLGTNDWGCATWAENV